MRYPLVEAATALFFVAVVLRFWPTDIQAMSTRAVVPDALVLVAYLYFAAISIALVLIDIDTQKLPNRIVLPGYLVGAILLGSASLISGDVGALASAGVGALALAALFYILSLAGGMGMGDVKLAGVIGLLLGWLGWEVLIVGTIATFILGGLFGVSLLVSRRATGKTGVPFGPWMLAGAWVAIFAGPEIGGWYLALFGIGES